MNRKLFISVILLFVSMTIFGQMRLSRYPSLCPKDIVERDRNAVMVARGFKNPPCGYTHLQCPLYLNEATNGKLIVKWYRTETRFGEKMKASETPVVTDEATYKNGLLSFYKTSRSGCDSHYRFEWSNNRLQRVIAYKSDGREHYREEKRYVYDYCSTPHLDNHKTAPGYVIKKDIGSDIEEIQYYTVEKCSVTDLYNVYVMYSVYASQNNWDKKKFLEKRNI